MAFDFVYLGLGQVFDRSRKPASGAADIHPFAAPFYAPAFLLSAISLSLASQEKMLSIQVYSAGVILYALASVLFRETLFYYPAAWLARYLFIIVTDSTGAALAGPGCPSSCSISGWAASFSIAVNWPRSEKVSSQTG
jgi:hypothetical protein